MSDLENPLPPTIPQKIPQRKATIKLGQRELSRISLAVVLLIVTGLLFGGYRTYKTFKSQRDIVLNQNNLLSLYKALRLYAMDHEDRLPPAEHWLDEIEGYIAVPQGTPGGKEGVMKGPADDGEVGYVYNDVAAGYNIEPKAAEEDRQKEVAPKYLVLLIQRAGAGRNAHEKLAVPGTPSGDDEFVKSLQFPHYASDPDGATTVTLFASGNVQRYIKRDFKK